MIDHVSVGTHRYADAVAFYRRVLAPLGLELQVDDGKQAAFGTGGHWLFVLYPAAEGSSVVGERTHVAFGADSRRQIDDVHARALDARGTDIFTPRTRPDVSATYYGAMFRDLDGHSIEVKTDAA